MNFEDLYRCELFDIPSPALDRLKLLFPKLKRLESLYGKPLVVTSGYRTKAEHISIYRNINDKRLLVGLNEFPVPLHSAHLRGDAADIADPESLLKTWIGSRVPLLEELNLWCESFASTPNWLHVQQVPPKSGKRFFRPF